MTGQAVSGRRAFLRDTFDRRTPIGSNYDAHGAPAPPRDGLDSLSDLFDLFDF